MQHSGNSLAPPAWSLDVYSKTPTCKMLFARKTTIFVLHVARRARSLKSCKPLYVSTTVPHARIIRFHIRDKSSCKLHIRYLSNSRIIVILQRRYLPIIFPPHLSTLPALFVESIYHSFTTSFIYVYVVCYICTHN